jgi:hypothetical protein
VSGESPLRLRAIRTLNAAEERKYPYSFIIMPFLGGRGRRVSNRRLLNQQLPDFLQM